MKEDYKNIYFVGAGGIGMSALERYFLSKGMIVGGYDRTPSELTDELATEGVEINFDESVEAIPEKFLNPKDTLIVYTPAIPSDMPQLAMFRKEGFEVIKRAALLGIVTRQSRSLCFAGTHGKTTTSSMAAHILHNSSLGCNAFLGGILRNYGTNFLLCSNSEYSVIEADEFDRSFHQLTPYVAVVTSTDPDHLDIYGTEEAYLESFRHFTELILPDGYLILHEDLKLKPNPKPSVTTFTYSRDKGNFHAANICHGNGEIHFDLVRDNQVIIKDINLGVPVEVNIENAIAAMAACIVAGVEDYDSIRSSISSFMGAKRRFEFLKKEDGPNGKVIIDDYAHHPDELKASISSVKALYPDRKLTVVFQPHLYTRTRDFYHGFAQALSIADCCVLLPIYPAREEPLPGITSEIIYDEVTSPEKYIKDKTAYCDFLASKGFDILLLAGAGDLDQYVNLNKL